ncbi:MAG: hypothetical protein RI945_149 [Candidatus Parcubacteria bacterium]|jgi:hypothetical protein
MKKFIFVACSIFFSFNFANSQKDTMKLSSVEVASGKGAVASGLYGYATLANKKSSLMLTLSADDLEVTYLRKFAKGKVMAGVNGGYWYNVPYGSAQFIWNPTNFFGVFSWVGYGFGDPGTKVEIRPRFYFSVQQGTITANKNFSGSYTLIHYLDNVPQHIGNVKYTGKVNENFSFYTSIGYDFTKESQLLQLGMVYRPGK